MRDSIAPSAPHRGHLTVAELVSRLAADGSAPAPRALRSAAAPVMSVQQLLHREGRSAALSRLPAPDEPASLRADRRSSLPVPPPQHGTVPVAPPAQHRTVPAADRTAADRSPDPGVTRLVAAPQTHRPRFSVQAGPTPSAGPGPVPRTATDPVRHAARRVPAASDSVPVTSDSVPVAPGLVPMTSDLLPFRPASSSTSSGSRRSRQRRSASRRPLIVGSAVAGTAMFVGSVASSALPGSPGMPADQVRVDVSADPAAPPVSAGTMMLGAAASGATADPVTTKPRLAPPPRSLPPLG